MVTISSREEARRFLDDINTANGIVARKDWAKLEALDKQLSVRMGQAWQGMSGILGKSIIKVAKHLYTEDVRFLFELLQNCEDNSYENAKKRGEEPQVLIEIFSDRMVMECNEDGFNAANLRAICSVWNSSKTGPQAYVGEKGIGFKSVFKVANEVIIQSGYFAFSFKHDKGESGMGMITPEWLSEDEEQKLAPVKAGTTRITLMYRQDGDTEDVVASVNKQAKDLQEEMLLFMRKLKRIMVMTYDFNGTHKDTTTYLCVNSPSTSNNMVSTRKITQSEGGEPKCTTKNFFLCRHTATNLPESKSRDYTKEALAARTYATSKVVLAFPLSEDMIPLLKNQWFFSFLPVARTGFKFIIQADFETAVHRQSIETSSKRNKALGKHIVQAFIGAILGMCNQTTSLQYQWMRFLPSTDDGNAWDPFWVSIIRDIAECLKKTPVLRSAGSRHLCKIQDLKILIPETVDEEGEPLFNDIEPEIYLAREYLLADGNLLKKFGLEVIGMSDLFKRLRHDLNSAASRMKGSTTTYDWHSRAAVLLQLPFDEGSEYWKTQLREIRLLPLRDGTWDSILNGPAYYPDLDSLTVPGGLQLTVIDPSAAKHPDRRRLFDLLGVQTANIEMIREHIARRYQQSRISVKKLDSIADLQFLYLTHNNRSRIQEKLHIWLFDGTYLQDPRQVDLYISSDDPLSPAQLISRTSDGPDPEDGRLNFIEDRYLKNPPPNPPSDLPTWVNWLHDTIGVRRDLRLKDPSSYGLSGPVKYVAIHQPSKFMPLVNKLWRLQGSELRNNDIIKDELRKTKVLCRGAEYHELRNAYLPTKTALAIADRFLVKDDPFYWIQTQDQPDGVVTKHEWQMLAKSLDIGFPRNEIDLVFSILEYICRLTTLPWSSDDRKDTLRKCYSGANGLQNIHSLYIYLDAQARGAKDTAELAEEVRKRFEAAKLVYILRTGKTEDAVSWAYSNDCVWDTPISHVNTVHVLSDLFSQTSNLLSLESFFKDLVRVPQWHWKHTVEEIEFCRDERERDVDFDVLLELYQDLARIQPGTATAEALRHKFATKKLINCRTGKGKDDWQSSGDCLWTMATSFPGKIPINNDGEYDHLTEFFLDVVGVKQVTLTMLYNKLRMPGLDVSLKALKADLLEMSALMKLPSSQDEMKDLDPSKLRNNKIFPVRQPDGEIVRLRADGLFAIVDRASLGSSFRDEMNLLDFSLEEVHGLEPFIRWSGLKDRYLSALVKENSSADRSSSRPISEPHREIRKKAGALLIIAAACGSPRVANGRLDEFYQRLRKCQTFETNRIHTELSLTFPGHKDAITARKDTGVLVFIADDADSLKVYVPRVRADRDACFFSKLPRCFLEFMMRHKDTNISGTSDDTKPDMPRPEILFTLQAVLNAYPVALKGVLGESSLPDLHERFDDEVGGSNDENEDDEEHHNADTSQSGSHLQQPTNDGSPTARPQGSFDGEDDAVSRSGVATSETDDADRVLTPIASRASDSDVGEAASSNEEDIIATVTSRAGNLRAHSASGSGPRVVLEQSPTPGPQYAPQAAVAGVTPYQRFLEQVVDTARQLVFPSRGSFNMSDMTAALPDGEARTDPVAGLPFLATFGKLERDKMVGAAGELFVYELLRSTQLSLSPTFDTSNWRSNIRGYVQAHPEHAHLTSWRGRETADLTYTDDNGTLTAFLADKGYLQRYDVDTLRAAKPTYHLEVKSTPYAYETPFFMSRKQYQKMRDWSQSVSGQEGNLNHVYIILRVFNLGRASASVRVLVDPHSMELRGDFSRGELSREELSRERLRFEAESWTVTPCN